MATREQIMARLRRKCEIIKLDRKARNDPMYHDMNELLTLLDMLERAEGNES